MNYYKQLLLIVLALLFTIAGHTERRDIHILCTNDMHAAIGSFPQLAALIDSLRTSDPGLLVFSAGDNRTGNPLNDKYEIPAYPMVALMNMVGFNASALGNHEFDNHTFKRLVGLSNFRYLCANIQIDDTLGISTLPCQVFDVGGIKVGVVGAIELGPKGIPSTHPDNLRGIHFTQAADELGKYEWMRRDCDATILLSHLGYDNDVAMASRFPWFDLIIGGHTHKKLTDEERWHDGVLVTQNKNQLQHVTYVTLTVDSGRVVDKRAEYIDITSYPHKSKMVEAMVQFFNNSPQFSRVIAQATTPFGTKEELGYMMCDAYMDFYGADVALANPGGVRLSNLAKGDITVLDVLRLDPFDNHAVVLDLTGKELVDLMVNSCSGNVRSFPYVGGVHCEVTLDPANPKKIKNVRLTTLDGKRFNLKRRYRVVTNNYITSLSPLSEGVVQPQPDLTNNLVIRFLEKQGKVSYKGVSRVTVK